VTAPDPELPARYREARLAVFDDATEPGYLGEVGKWLQGQRAQFSRGGDPAGAERFNYELTGVDELWRGFGQARERVVDLLPEAIEKVGIPDFDLEFLEMHATLYHHGGHFMWHTDRNGYDGLPVATRRLSWCLYMHSDPRMFTGGELEFVDGTIVESAHNRLVFFDPLQQHRVRAVECYSADFIHGRWALFGWLHGQPPETAWPTPYVEGIPASG